MTSPAKWLPAVAATFSVVPLAMDLFMTPIATSALIDDFHTDARMVQAAIALFSLIFAALTILGGKLGDIFGKKRIFRIGLAIYALAAAITTFAPNMTMLLVGFSFVRAVGAALAVPASVALIVANYEEDDRGHAFAIYGVGTMIAGLVAPLLMGLMADEVSWRIPFGIEILLILVAILLAGRMRETPTVRTRVDTLETILAFLSIGAVVLGGMLGGRYGWWDARRPFEIGGTVLNPLELSPSAVLFLFGIGMAVVLLGTIHRKETRGEPTLFSLKLFDNRVFAVVFIMSGLIFLLNGALPFVIPVFLQEAVTFNGATTGLVMMAFMIGSVITSFVSGRLVARMQPRLLMQLAMLVILAGLVWLFAVAGPDMGVMTAALPMFVTGLGFGPVITQIPNLQLSTLPRELQGEASGLAETGKEVGIGLGTAVIGSILFGLAVGNMVDGVAKQVQVELTPAGRAELILQVEEETIPVEVEELIAKRVPDLAGVIRAAYVDAFQVTLGVLAGVVLSALLVVSFVPNLEPVVRK